MAVISHKSVISPILVGRQSEVDVLAGLLDQSRQGHGQLALLVGEAGIGKSRLSAEVKERASALGFWTFEGPCDLPEQLISYAPLLEILHELNKNPASNDLRSRLGAAASIFAKYFPELELSITGSAVAYAPEQEKRLLHHTLTLCLQELAVQRPLLLLFEDLHWADDATLEFLLYFVRRLADQPIFLLLTYRGNEITSGLGRFIAAVEREHIAIEIALSPLTTRQVDEMMRAIFDLDRPVRSEFLRAMSELTEGNPFFIEEVLKSLLAVGDIYYAENAWDRRPMGELRTPRTISDAVQRRAANLSAPAQKLLSLAAVAGHRFDVAVLQVVTQQDDETILAALKELVSAQLIIEAGTDAFSFRHALTQQALYLNLLARERQAMHRALAQTILQLNEEKAEAIIPELAFHSHAGGAWIEAWHYTRRAGEQAEKLHLLQAAIQQYSRALEAADNLSFSSVLPLERATILRARGNAFERVGSFEQAQTDLQGALALVRAHAGQEATSKMEWQLLLDLGFLWTARDYARTGKYYHHALLLAQQIEEPTLLAHTYNRLGNWQLNRGEQQAALHSHEQALPIFQAQHDSLGIAQTLDYMGMASGQLGDSRGVAYFEQAATIFREVDDPVALVNTLAMLGTIRTYLGQVGEEERAAARVAADFSEALELAQRVGYQSGEVFALCECGQIHAWAGNYRAAFGNFQRALTLAKEIEHYQWQSAIFVGLGGIYLDLMLYETAHSHLEQSLALAQQANSYLFAQISASTLALLYLELGQADKAESSILPFQRDIPTSFYDHFCWLVSVRLALWRNDPAFALQLLNRCQPTFVSGEQVHWVSLGLRQAKAQALVALGDPSTETLLREVCTEAQRKMIRPFHWRLRIELGNYLRNQKRLDEAEQEFAGAQTEIEWLAKEIEDEALAAHFRQRALAMIPSLPSATPRQVAKRAFDGLTIAEQRVAALVAQGKSNREIATIQVVSIKTVEAHISHILSKLNFSSRAQIAVWAVEKRLTASLTSDSGAASKGL